LNELFIRQDSSAKTESYFCTSDLVAIDHKVIDFLKDRIEKTGSASVRVCLHNSPEDSFHQMIIAHRKGQHYRPHKHLKKTEAYQMILGTLDVVIFNDDGNVRKVTQLSADGNFIYRIPPNTWHCTVPVSDIVIFHEVKPGPFLPDSDSIYPEWDLDEIRTL
jgi:cupin fold WbuC family metalloprotein